MEENNKGTRRAKGSGRTRGPRHWQEKRTVDLQQWDRTTIRSRQSPSVLSCLYAAMCNCARSWRGGCARYSSLLCFLSAVLMPTLHCHTHAARPDEMQAERRGERAVRCEHGGCSSVVYFSSCFRNCLSPLSPSFAASVCE
jgi:hypothetical protein